MTAQSDLNPKAQWERYCSLYNHYPQVGLTLDISRMAIPSGFFEQMEGKVQQAFKDMKALEKGEIVNPDEKRMVGHYWLRDPERAPTAELKREISESVTRIKLFANKVHSGSIKPQKASQFKNVLLIGIGGSALGPQLVGDALMTPDDPMKVYFFDNTDPDGMARVISQIGDGLKETICLIISKSGGTIETRNGQLEAAAAFESQGLAFGPHAVAITCQDSKLDKQAAAEKWLDRFYLWDWVGGRTSLFSAVGLVVAALQGVEIDEFLLGAKQMDEITRSEVTAQNPSALLALMWYAAGGGQGKKDMVLLPYKDRLCLFSKYLQQLVMESLGKEHDLQGKVVNQGIAVYGNKGSTDQHAYVQQLRDGLNNFFVTFIEVLSDFTPYTPHKQPIEVDPGVSSGDYLSGFFQGTRSALFGSKRDTITITIDQLDTRVLGAMIALYDRAVGIYASLVGINAYHQPGVEAGKKAASRVIELQAQVLKTLKGQKSDGLTAEQISTECGAADDVETIYKILEHLSVNNAYGVQRSGERMPKQAKYKIA